MKSPASPLGTGALARFAKDEQNGFLVAQSDQAYVAVDQYAMVEGQLICAGTAGERLQDLEILSQILKSQK